ncbi:MAG TPA: multicopper oxidase domain-containing protein [Candidatus Baltobacteraceae bacterium]|nr:multicopper oxidase domain-containing protein [Candidatus Baltobacteraceae bacterium]
MPIASGSLEEPPQITMSRLPLDDLGQHELILRVVRAGDRFCYRYALDGIEHHVAPILKVRQGERFSVRLVNELRGPAKGATMTASALPACMPRPMMPAKSTAFVGYLNHTMYARTMDMPDIDVNMHFHGFQGPPQQENIFLSTLSTPAHACEYDVTIPRAQPPGTYYYHPHAHGMADDEVAGGLSGMWIVEPATPQIPPSDEHAVIISYRVPYVLNNDFLPHFGALARAGAARIASLKPMPAASYDPFNPPPWPSAMPIRQGSVALHEFCGSRPGVLSAVDGVDAPATLTVPAGEPQLLRVLNATSDTVEFLRVRDASGKDRPMQIVGRDGVPVGGDFGHPLSRFIAMRQATLVPTGRADVLLTLAPGDVLTFYSAGHCQGPGDEFALKTDLLTVRAGAPSAAPATVASLPLQQTQSPAAQLLRFARSHPQLVRRRAITYTEYLVPGPKGHGLSDQYYITQTSLKNFHEQPFRPVYAKGARTPNPDIVVKQGSIEEWYLYNATLETHSFHIHQMDFVAEDAKPGPAMLDTTIVPFGKLLPNKANPDYPLIVPSLTRVLLDFRHVPRGTFVFHCHMLFHEDHGMMATIRVE